MVLELWVGLPNSRVAVRRQHAGGESHHVVQAFEFPSGAVDSSHCLLDGAFWGAGFKL
jgi:hypothetical protein